MRCFIAVDLPDDLKNKLKNIKINGADVTYPKDYHITLRFFGDIKPKVLFRIKEKLKKIKFNSFKLNLDKIWRFPKSGYAKVVWIGINPKRKLLQLKKLADEAIIELFGSERDFDPHITLARIKFISDKKKFDDVFKINVDGNFNVLSFKLIESKLNNEGPEYEVIEEYMLK